MKYNTINAPASSDFRDRGSKFFGFAFPVNSVEDVKKELSALKKEHPKATHHCYAYRIGTDGNVYRTVDDGEPSGSAGKPILNAIDSAGVTNVLVVVVRYFGGSLLGVPGLINAYYTATAEALAKTTIIEKLVEENYELSFDYPIMNEVLYLLRQSSATIHEQELQLFCRIVAGIPKQETAVLAKLSELRGLTMKKI